MGGNLRIRRTIPSMVGVGLLCLPGLLTAQTGAERARAEERVRALEKARAEELARAELLQKRLEARLQFTEQEGLERLAEVEFRVQEELARAQRVQEARLREVRQLDQERAREVASRMRVAREANVTVQEQLHRVQEQLQRARQEAQRAQQVMVQVRTRVRLGVSLDGIQESEFDDLGARVSGTLDGSPAEEAGIREGDVITHLNGHSLLEPISAGAEEDFDDGQSLPVQRLMALAQELEAGEEVEVRYIRDGSPRTVSFETAEVDAPSISILRSGEGDEPTLRIMGRPGGEDVYRVRPGEGGVWSFEGPDDVRRNIVVRRGPGSDAGSWTLRTGEMPAGLLAFRGGSAGFGLRLAEMNPGLSEYFRSDKGLLVLEIDEDSPLGLSAGDVILAIDGRPVRNQRDVTRILGSYEEGESVSFTVVRKGGEERVEGTVG